MGLKSDTISNHWTLLNYGVLVENGTEFTINVSAKYDETNSNEVQLITAIVNKVVVCGSLGPQLHKPSKCVV